MITIFFVGFYFFLFTLGTLVSYESDGILAFEFLRNTFWIFSLIIFIYSFFIFLKEKLYKNKFLLTIIFISITGFIVNIINFLNLESTPIYFSINSIFGIVLGLKFTSYKKISEKIDKGLLFFGLINLIISINQILVGLSIIKGQFLLYGVGLGPDIAPFGLLSRPTGTYSNPFSLAVLGALLIALPVRRDIYLYRIVGTLLVFFSSSRAFIFFTSFHLLFWIVNTITKKIFKKTSSIFIALSIFSLQIYLGSIYLSKFPTNSFIYKSKAIPNTIYILLTNPSSLLFGFTQANVDEFFSLLEDADISYITQSFESWFLRMFIFGGIFLALVYLYPLFKVHTLSMNYNKEMLFYSSSLICTSAGSFFSNGGFGGPNSWIYFYIIAYIYTRNKLVNSEKLLSK